MIIVVKKQVFQNMYNERHLLRKKFQETGGFLANPEAPFLGWYLATRIEGGLINGTFLLCTFN